MTADYEKSIKSRCCDKKSPKIAYLNLKNFPRKPFFSHRARKIELACPKNLIILYDDRHRRCRLFLPITTDTSNNLPITSITDVCRYSSSFDHVSSDGIRDKY